MYGMVNKAIEDMITSQHGEELWERVRARAGVNVEVFISNESYPDEITYGLVVAASEILEQPAADILHAFGEWWVLKTANEGYGALMKAAGKTLPEFLINLPNFHTRVAMIFPRLHPPLFRCSDVTETSLHLHYLSHRQGLSPFVCGLLAGLGKMFETPVDIQHVMQKDQGDDHDVYLVSWPLAASCPPQEA